MIRIFIIIILSVSALTCKSQNLDSLIFEAEYKLSFTDPLNSQTFFDSDSVFCFMYKTDFKRLVLESDLYFLYRKKLEIIPALQKKDSINKKNILLLEAEKQQLQNSLLDAQKTLYDIEDIYKKKIAITRRKCIKNTIFITIATAVVVTSISYFK